MSGDQMASSALVIGCFVLVASGLAARRLPVSDMLSMALAWAGIFAGAALLVRWLL